MLTPSLQAPEQAGESTSPQSNTFMGPSNYYGASFVAWDIRFDQQGNSREAGDLRQHLTSNSPQATQQLHLILQLAAWG